MEFPILVKWHLYIESGPRSPVDNSSFNRILAGSVIEQKKSRILIMKDRQCRKMLSITFLSSLQHIQVETKWPQFYMFVWLWSVGRRIGKHVPDASAKSLQWRHKKRDGVSNNRRLDQLLTQPLVQAQIKAPRHWPLRGESADAKAASWYWDKPMHTCYVFLDLTFQNTNVLQGPRL